MAQRRKVKPPHKLGDGGFRREHPNLQKFIIGPMDGREGGPEITITVCRHAGRIVTRIKAPAELKIVVCGSKDESRAPAGE